jgi:hypothetical protein
MPSSLRRVLVAATFIGAVAAAMPARADTIERVLAVLDNRPVLLSEVTLQARLLKQDLRAAVESTIDERLMAREAARIPQAASTREEEDAAYQSLVRNLDSDAATADEAGLRRIARRQLAVLKYIEFRFRPQVRVEDEAVRTAYEEQYGGDPDAPGFEDAAQQLRAAAVIRRNPLGSVANPLID